MNPFVNPKKRDVLLPDGCKDLMDVLRLSKHGDEIASQGQVTRPENQVDELAHLQNHMIKLLASGAQVTGLAIASLDGQMRVMLERAGGRFGVYPVMGMSERERDVEDFFAERAILPCADFWVGNPGKQTRILGYPLPFDPAEAASLIVELVRSAYGLDVEAELEFTYF